MKRTVKCRIKFLLRFKRKHAYNIETLAMFLIRTQAIASEKVHENRTESNKTTRLISDLETTVGGLGNKEMQVLNLNLGKNVCMKKFSSI